MAANEIKTKKTGSKMCAWRVELANRLAERNRALENPLAAEVQ